MIFIMVWRFIFYAFLFYLAYKLVFDLVIPLFRTTRKIKKGIREMQERMGQQSEPQQRNTTNTTASGNGQAKKGDYIDFEEVK